MAILLIRHLDHACRSRENSLHQMDFKVRELFLSRVGKCRDAAKRPGRGIFSEIVDLTPTTAMWRIRYEIICRAPPIIPPMKTQDHLVRLWEEHIEHEFATRDTEATLATMADDAYVNHIPVMTGGYGKAALRRFYSRDFIPSMPPDTILTPVSRTVGADQIVDEMIFSFTHSQEMPWMLPGIAPTNRRVEVPLVAIVHFRNDKLAHEHIYWDQASVLKQIGLLRDSNLPVFGAETAHKVTNPNV